MSTSQRWLAQVLGIDVGPEPDDVVWRGGIPFLVSTAPTTDGDTSEAESVVDFDGGTREPAPPPPGDPVREHDAFIHDLLGRDGEFRRDGGGWDDAA
jgi:hypothetical protein